MGELKKKLIYANEGYAFYRSLFRRDTRRYWVYFLVITGFLSIPIYYLFRKILFSGLDAAQFDSYLIRFIPLEIIVLIVLNFACNLVWHKSSILKFLGVVWVAVPLSLFLVLARVPNAEVQGLGRPGIIFMIHIFSFFMYFQFLAASYYFKVILSIEKENSLGEDTYLPK